MRENNTKDKDKIEQENYELLPETKETKEQILRKIHQIYEN